MTVATNDVIKITAVLLGPDLQEFNNVFHYQYREGTGVDDATYMAALAQKLDAMYTIINDRVADDVAYDQIRFYNVTQDYPMGTVGWPTLTNGIDLAEPLPSGNAALVTAYTAVKRTYGRKFLPGWTEAMSEGDTWTAAAFADLQAFAGEWFLSVAHPGGGNSYAGVWKVPLVDPAYFVDFVSMNAREIVAYQRRRKPGVGA